MIDPTELKIETYPLKESRGGQHVTLTETGVKVTHLPTGITASVTTQRSQYRNKNIAVSMIEAALTHPDYG